ncbi:MAG: hypothetical protein H6729_08430 [Deltaproteobacteria bacterium]|nr:hypothetical protein [Deltaproteobacteria bacterium]
MSVSRSSLSARPWACKRPGDKLVADLARFAQHVKGFLSVLPKFASWNVEQIAIAPSLTKAQRATIEGFGYLAQDLGDLTRGL